MQNHQADVSGGRLDRVSLPKAELEDFVRQEIASRGRVVLRGERSEDEFRALCGGLGTIWHESDVKITEGGKQYFITPSSLPWHTDSPFANIIAWFARVPCPYHVGTRILDLRDLLQELSPHDVRLLSEVQVPLPMASERAFEASGFYPMLTVDNAGRPLLNYIDWTTKRVPSKDHYSAIDRFREVVKRREVTHCEEIPLGKGEILLLDNNRSMHGRSRIPADSPRHLIRLWINTDGVVHDRL